MSASDAVDLFALKVLRSRTLWGLEASYVRLASTSLHFVCKAHYGPAQGLTVFDVEAHCCHSDNGATMSAGDVAYRLKMAVRK